MNRPCSLCGSTNWPDPESLCPLCDGPAEPGPDLDDDPDHDSHDETTYQENHNQPAMDSIEVAQTDKLGNACR